MMLHEKAVGHRYSLVFVGFWCRSVATNRSLVLVVLVGCRASCVWTMLSELILRAVSEEAESGR